MLSSSLSRSVIEVESLISNVYEYSLFRRDGKFLELPYVRHVLDYDGLPSILWRKLDSDEKIYFELQSPPTEFLKFMPTSPASAVFLLQQPSRLEPQLNFSESLEYESNVDFKTFPVSFEEEKIFLATCLFQNDRCGFEEIDAKSYKHENFNFLEETVLSGQAVFDNSRAPETLTCILFPDINTSKFCPVIMRTPEIISLDENFPTLELSNMLAVSIPFDVWDHVVFEISTRAPFDVHTDDRINWPEDSRKQNKQVRQFMFKINQKPAGNQEIKQTTAPKQEAFRPGTCFLINLGLLKNYPLIRALNKQEVNLVERDFGAGDHQLIGIDGENLIWIMKVNELAKIQGTEAMNRYCRMFSKVTLVLTTYSYQHKVRYNFHEKLWHHPQIRQKLLLSKMDIKSVMGVLARHAKISVMFADEVEEVLSCIHRIAENCPHVGVEEEMSAVQLSANYTR
jgi:hypothetical protein